MNRGRVGEASFGYRDDLQVEWPPHAMMGVDHNRDLEWVGASAAFLV